MRRANVCRFINANKTGDYDPLTDRFDGAIGDLMDGKVDVFFRLMEFGSIDSKYVDFLGAPFLAFGFSPGHLIERLTSQKAERSLSVLYHFLVPSTAYLALMVTGLLLFRLASALFRNWKPRQPSRRKVRLRLLSFLYLFFVFFMSHFFGGNLNTQNVVVRTDGLLYSKEQILKTNKE